ncbi:methylmalonyl Co-A mutase-associated GTPase MeaB [bacterium]|nr:methylmalonyl Co-A mutase-associated GTPase MeaB [bacterium]MBU1985435.1 methylmalonyl Co-A mutase-associated GTPase MeaB [bacterium]
MTTRTNFAQATIREMSSGREAADRVEEMLRGSRVALARVLSQIENRPRSVDGLLKPLAGRIGRAVRIGFTGPPGAGKSTLVTAYARLLRECDQRIGVLAVDPTSPFSGGALLGDRVRMSALASDENIFVRSLATRGGLGGLAEAAGDMADVFDAVGYDTVIFETVGVGQSELEVAQHADCTVVVLVPESGDSIQGMKAGLMEIADVFVLNKADREGADRFASELRAAMHLKDWGAWTPPVVKTVAVKGEGIAEFHDHVSRYLSHLRETGLLAKRRAARIRRRCQRLVEHRLLTDFWNDERRAALESGIRDLKSPYEISSELLKRDD